MAKMSSHLQLIGVTADRATRATGTVRSRARGVARALAFVALALFVARPFCDAAFAAETKAAAGPGAVLAPQAIEPQRHPAEVPAATCCASIEQGAIVNAMDVPVSWSPGDTPGAFHAAGAGRFLARSADELAKGSFAALPERSYYARSARIQR